MDPMMADHSDRPSHSSSSMPRSVIHRAAKAAKKKKSEKRGKRVPLSKAQARAAGRKAAHMMEMDDSSLTAEGEEMKKKQAFAIAAHKMSKMKKRG